MRMMLLDGFVFGCFSLAVVSCGGSGSTGGAGGASTGTGGGTSLGSSSVTSSSSSGTASSSSSSGVSSSGQTSSGSGSSSSTTSSSSSGSSSSSSTTSSSSSGSSSSSSSSGYVGTKTPGTPQAGDIKVDPSTTHQVVDGFGEADVWQGSSSTAMQTLLFDPVNGIGLTLLRIGIESASGTSVLMGNAGIADGKACVKYAGSDCKVWAAPWSPPASMKNNNNVNGGGANDTLKTTDYDAWATLLAAFPAYYKQQSGVDLYAISAQNEPDFNPSYEACTYDKNQMVTFIKALGPKLAALNPPVKVLAAEPDNWGNLWGGDGFGPAILADSMADSYVGPIATHDYGGTSAGTYARPAPPANNTHHVWETECTPNDTGPITIATMVYAAFTTGGVNAWHYWWTQQFVPNVNSPPPQVYALGNFSKFVRPGYYRVDVTGAPPPSASGPLVVAFTNKSDGTVAIVVVNGGAAKQVSFFVAGMAWPASVTPYVTTTSSKLAAGTPITVTAARFSASLDAQSVTTFVGKP
jgi:glucuronoarabinoxylan endo-1,4-beta-xylanase